MFIRDGLSLVLADARYLRKDAAATDQTIAGTGTITVSAYNVTMSAGQLSVTWATNTVAATFLNSSIAGGVAGSFQRSGTGGTALQVGDNATLTKFTVTAAGAFTASAASTINAAANTGINIPLSGSTNSSGLTHAGTVVSVRSTNGFVEMSSDGNAANTRAIIAAGLSSSNYWGFTVNATTTRGRWFIAGLNSTMEIDSITTFTQTTGNGLTFNSNASSGANTGFTFNATNGPNTLAAFQSGGTTYYLCDVSNRRFFINAGNAALHPAIAFARNSTTTSEADLLVSGASSVGFLNGTQGDFILRVANTAKAVLLGPGGDSTNSPFSVTATFSGNNILTSVLTAGASPASVAGNGTAATNPSLVGSVGGASSGVTGQTGGTGSTWTITAGAGGAVAGASGIGGAGGGLTVTCGAGGNGAATGGAGGSITLTAGSAGTGGNANGGTITLKMGAKTGSGTNGTFTLSDASQAVVAIGYTGLVTEYGDIATEGWGVGGILKQGYQVASSGAGAQNTTIATYTVAAAGLYLVEGTVSVTTADTVTVTVTYTDSVNTTAQTITVVNAVVHGANSSTSWRIMVDANTSTAISVQITNSAQATTKCSASTMRVR